MYSTEVIVYFQVFIGLCMCQMKVLVYIQEGSYSTYLHKMIKHRLTLPTAAARSTCGLNDFQSQCQPPLYLLVSNKIIMIFYYSSHSAFRIVLQPSKTTIFPLRFEIWLKQRQTLHPMLTIPPQLSTFLPNLLCLQLPQIPTFCGCPTYMIYLVVSFQAFIQLLLILSRR